MLLFHGRVDRRKGVAGPARGPLPDGVPPGACPASARTWRRRGRRAGERIDDSSATCRYEDAPEVYRGADVFVSPTYARGSATPSWRPWPAGCRSSPRDAVGVVDAVRDGENGLLITPATSAPWPRRCAGCWTTRRCAQRLAAAALDEVPPAVLLAGAGADGSPACTSSWPAPPRTLDWAPAAWTVDLSCRFRSAPHLL